MCDKTMKILYVFIIVSICGPTLQCGYEACPKVNFVELNVHIIPHSHDEVGRIKTVDEYYFGSKSDVDQSGVQYIIDSVIQALLANPKRRYIQVESVYLHKWWQEQNNEKRQQVRELVQNGQLEIVGGAWTMNDESTTHYHSIIDQFTHGLKFLEDNLGACARPKIGWQIDTFGHTREMASIFAQLGYDAVFLSRVDWRDKEERLSTGTAEMLWRSSANFGNDSLLFTHILYNHYNPPSGFYFDILSEDERLLPDEKSPDYNIREKMVIFTEYIRKMSVHYTSNNVLVTMGNDFAYQDAHYNYNNLDSLIKAFEDIVEIDEKGRRIRLFYSTPSCYVKAVNDYANAMKLTYKVKADDFIPYATNPHAYWSGYYTSRPTLKRLERQGNNLLQIAKQMTARAPSPDSGNPDVEVSELKSAMGIIQHHYAISGTTKQTIANDYTRIITKAFDRTSSVTNIMLKKLLVIPGKTTDLVFKSCMLANISHCEESQKERFVVAIYNPLSQRVSHHVRLPVDSDSFEVTDFTGKPMITQVTPSIDGFEDIPNIHISKFDLVFYAEDLLPLSVKVFYVINKKYGETVADIEPVKPAEGFSLGNDTTGVKLKIETGFLSKIHLYAFPIDITQELMYYVGAKGNDTIPSNQSSSASVFRPDPDSATAKQFTNNILTNLTAYKGELVEEVHQTFNSWAKQIIRLYKNIDNYIEFDWLIGPIDIADGNSKEIISRFKLSKHTDTGNFFIDSNGRELLTKVNNYRATYNYTNNEEIAGNYYPITSSISSLDPDKGFEGIVITDRSQGGTSLRKGEVELMVHRRLVQNGTMDVDESLNEEEFGKGLRVRGQHYFTFGTTTDNVNYTRASQLRRVIAQQKILAPWVFLADASGEGNTFNELRNKLQHQISLVKRMLPDQIQILTLEQWRDDEILLRFEHIFEVSAGGTVETINLRDLFTQFTIQQLYETTLGGNQRIEENHRLQWTPSDCLSESSDCMRNTQQATKNYRLIQDWKITLAPMQIRTFIATVT